jgi:hypothetical protein
MVGFTADGPVVGSQEGSATLYAMVSTLLLCACAVPSNGATSGAAAAAPVA